MRSKIEKDHIELVNSATMNSRIRGQRSGCSRHLASNVLSATRTMYSGRAWIPGASGWPYHTKRLLQVRLLVSQE